MTTEASTALTIATVIALDAQLAAKRAELAELHLRLAEEHTQRARLNIDCAIALQGRVP